MEQEPIRNELNLKEQGKTISDCSFVTLHYLVKI